MIEFEEEKEKRLKNSEETLKDLGTQSNGPTQRRERTVQREYLKMMTEDFPNLIKIHH